MGYYTRFEVTHTSDSYDQNVLIDHYFEKITGYSINSLSEIKWYDYDTDMRKLSKQFPHIVFTVEGDGEETGDHWKAYYKNGKGVIHRPKIQFPDYKEEDLE